jgi:hypothetical protein
MLSYFVSIIDMKYDNFNAPEDDRMGQNMDVWKKFKILKTSILRF